MQLSYKLLLHKEDDGRYTVNVPALPGCVTYGDNIEEAISMAKEAIELYIDELHARNEIVPDDSDTIEYSINIATA
ncbi:MAG: type II toxin-antitoxin system HicB family antitoxin [Bacteroidota bacterium]